MVRFSVYVVWPSVLSLNNLKVLKIHKTNSDCEKHLYTRKIYTSVNFHNPWLALTGCQTTRPCLQQDNLTWACNPIENQHLISSQFKKHATMSSKLEPTIWSRDTSQQIPCFGRCQLTITWMSNIKEVCYKPSLVHVSVNLLAGVWQPSCTTPSLSSVCAHKPYH